MWHEHGCNDGQKYRLMKWKEIIVVISFSIRNGQMGFRAYQEFGITISICLWFDLCVEGLQERLFTSRVFWDEATFCLVHCYVGSPWLAFVYVSVWLTGFFSFTYLGLSWNMCPVLCKTLDMETFTAPLLLVCLQLVLWDSNLVLLLAYVSVNVHVCPWTVSNNCASDVHLGTGSLCFSSQLYTFAG